MLAIDIYNNLLQVFSSRNAKNDKHCPTLRNTNAIAKSEREIDVIFPSGGMSAGHVLTLGRYFFFRNII